MNNQTKSALAAAIACVLASPGAWATFGYFSHAAGSKSAGMVGATTAHPLDTLAAANNPAGMAMMGDRMDGGIAMFSPLREYEVSGTPFLGPTMDFPPFPGPVVESNSKAFPLPHFGWNKDLGGGNSFGISVYGNGGMNTNYDKADTFFGLGSLAGGNAGIDYKQLFAKATYATKIGENTALGVSGVLNYSQFSIKGLSNFTMASVDPAHVSNNGMDDTFGFGVSVGILTELSDGVSLGAAYHSKIGNTLDEYAGLFTNGGELDIPASANIGVAFKVSDNTTITADIQQIWYSDVDAIGNSSSLINGCFAGNAANCFGGSQGAGFGWEDMTVFRVGIEHTSGDWTWRAGFGTGDQPIPEDEVTINVLAPGVVEDHFTLGFTKKTAGGNELSVDLMIAPSVTVSGPHLFVPGRTVDITMKQYQVGASFSW